MSCPDRDIFFCILKTDLVTFILSKFQLKQLNCQSCKYLKPTIPMSL
jgi:hypothetical protein